MNITETHVLAALAIALIAYQLGKKQTQSAPAVAQTNIAAPADWWSYAGTWGM
ncbi:MAG TPA: hypothetical protein VNU48_12320 [Burkholderiaceae bacterium]|nr:hypothetical protein [Burkholderiaceae bacterium]